MFQQDLDVIDVLRQDAISVREPHLSGVKKLQAYAGQLAWISGKFPIDVRLQNLYEASLEHVGRVDTMANRVD